MTLNLPAIPCLPSGGKYVGSPFAVASRSANLPTVSFRTTPQPKKADAANDPLVVRCVGLPSHPPPETVPGCVFSSRPN